MHCYTTSIIFMMSIMSRYNNYSSILNKFHNLLKSHCPNWTVQQSKVTNNQVNLVMVSLFLIYNSDSLIFAVIFPLGGLYISYYHQSISISSSRFLVCKKHNKIGFSRKSNIAIKASKIWSKKMQVIYKTLNCEL